MAAKSCARVQLLTRVLRWPWHGRQQRYTHTAAAAAAASTTTTATSAGTAVVVAIVIAPVVAATATNACAGISAGECVDGGRTQSEGRCAAELHRRRRVSLAGVGRQPVGGGLGERRGALRVGLQLSGRQGGKGRAGRLPLLVS